MLDLETLVKSCRLSCFKRLYTTVNASWKCYLSHLLEIFGGLFLLFHNDYDPRLTRYPLHILGFILTNPVVRIVCL